MGFYSMYNRPKRKPEVFNNKMQSVYKVTYDKNGVRKLTKDKEVNIYDKIQEYAKETNLTSMFSKYGVNAFDQLKKSEEQLVDLTNLPTNLMEAMSVINDAQYAFDRQSKEIKAKFNNDFKQFLAASESGQLAQMLNDEIKTSAEKFKTENMANYDASRVNLVNYTQQNAVQAPISNPQQQYVPVQPQNTQQGVNLNV